MRLIPPAPVMLLREVRTYLRAGRPRRSWAARWAAWPFWVRALLVAAGIWLAAPWAVKLTLWWWDRAFGAGAALNWVAPKL